MKRFNAHILNQERTELHKAVPLAAPFTMLVEVSRLCNFKCVFCPQSDKDAFRLFEKNIMPFEMFAMIAHQMTQFPVQVKKLYMHGTGESMLNPALPDMIALVKRLGAAGYVDLTSNGALIDDALGEKLIAAGLDHLHISVEALSDEGYAQVAGTDSVSFGNFVDGIRRFSAKRKNCRLSIKIADTSLSNEDDKKRFLDIFGPLCDDIFIEHIYPIWPGFELNDWGLHNKKIDRIGQYGQLIVDKDVCPQIFTTLAVKCDGSVSPCSVDWDNRNVLGNVNDMTLPVIWRSEKLRSLQLDHLERGRKTRKPCADCGLPIYSCIDNLDAHREEVAKQY